MVMVMKVKERKPTKPLPPPITAALTALAKTCFNESARLKGGSDLTVVEGMDNIEANAWYRTGMAILKARDCAKGNGV